MPVKSVAANIKMLVLDVDGVLTDAGLYLDSDGQELKRFNARDGLGIKTALRLGLKIGVITGLASQAVRTRVNNLGIEDYAEGIVNKGEVLDQMRRKYNLEWSEMAYVGDDWIDLVPLAKVGLPIAVDNAEPEVKAAAIYITEACGGHGAVREVIRLLLDARGDLTKAVAFWSQE